MNTAENNLVQTLTGKPSLQEATFDELEEISIQYPYFSIAQLLIAKKAKQQNSEHLAARLQHCAVYFQDLAWLQSQLYSRATDKRVEQSTEHNKKAAEEERSSDINVAIAAPEKAADIENANLITLPAEDVLENFTLEMNDVKDEPELPPLDEEDLANESEIPIEAAAKIADVLQHQVEEFKAPITEEPQLPISTEPYHTVDYFASQGIKVDAQMPDALGRKVHTFTDWLRQMKRISNYPTDLGSDPEMESFVQKIADTSNQFKAIDTEAMAEVLVKQGKTDKAIEVYQKLSLLNPGKTAYFAAKINQLKAG